MKKIIEQSIKKYFQLRQFRVKAWRKKQVESQELLLLELLASAEGTEFGREHGFTDIVSLEAFQNKVPVRSYEDLFPYIARALAGDADVLWPGRPLYFSKSSGTTNAKSKYIPVSHASLHENNYSAGRDIYTFYFMNYPESQLLEADGSVLSLSGSFQEKRAGIEVADISAIIARELPSYAAKRRLPSLATALLADWKTKIPRLIEESLGKNLTHLSGVPTWFISIFDELQKKHPYTHLREIWPKLELFIHGAVAFEPYRKLFEKLLPFEDMRYLEVYNASEGFFAIQDNLKKKGELLLLTDHGVFFEFIPLDRYLQGDRQTLPLSEVVCGVHYAMIISTNAGLWRYDIGDTVMFTHLNPFRVKITGRTKHFLNLCGEELMVGNTDAALKIACEKTGSLLEEYTVAPIFVDEHGKTGHEWVIEFKKGPKDLTFFTQILDDSLKSLNSDYAAKRQDDITLQAPKLHALPSGSFFSWMEANNRVGGQYKVPRLSQTRDVVEALLKKV